MACALTEHLVATGHQVMMSNSRGADSFQTQAVALKCCGGSIREAAVFGDIVILAIPLHALESVPIEPLNGKIVVDLINYYPQRDGPIGDLDAGRTTTSEMVAGHLSNSRVVKAFNAIMVSDLRAHGKPPGAPGRRGLPIAGDDQGAKLCVSRLVDSFGFDPVDVGPLAEGWRFERARPAYCIPLDHTALAETLASTLRCTLVAEGSWHRKE